jgi:hypothetical protein
MVGPNEMIFVSERPVHLHTITSKDYLESQFVCVKYEGKAFSPDMSDKIYLDFKPVDDGGIIVRINYNDPDLAGKSAVLAVKRKVTVKDSRPVHGSKTLTHMNLTLRPNGHNVKISPKTLKSIGAAFPYSGHMIKIETIVELEVNDSIIPFMDTVVKRSLTGHLPGKTPRRAKVSNNTKELIDPKDSFKFFKNLTALPIHNQLATIGLLAIGGILIVTNFFIGLHDQMAPDQMVWLYDHYDSDGDSSSPLVKALTGCGAIGALIWFAMRKQLRKYMTFRFDFKSPLKKINRESTVNVGRLIAGSSRVDLFDATLRVVACNLEKGQYVRGSGSNRRTISFRNPTRAVLLYSKRIPMISRGTPINTYFDQEFSFEPMFKSLYPRQMVTDEHGLDLAWEVQLIIDDFVDQELHGNPNVFIQEEFFKA